MQQFLSEQELLRREKLRELTAMGICAYPPEAFETNITAGFILSHYSAEKADEAWTKNVSIAGRIMSIRDMGKASFAVIQDHTGRIQLYIKRDEICKGDDKTLYDRVWKKLIDIGDIIGVTGYVFKTKTGEITIHVSTLKLLCKSLRPLPIVKEKEGELYDAVTDPEFRYRQRYVDLIINPTVREVFVKRTRMVQALREFLNRHGALEVETPVLQCIPGGAAARPFVTHHNALDTASYLRIANELFLKRLLVGGFDFVYEFSRNFRNEGMDRLHNPEFTILEFYKAWQDYYWMMDFTERLLEHTAIAVNGTAEVKAGEQTISFKAPFPRIFFHDAIKQYTGVDVTGKTEEELKTICHKLKLHVDPSMGKGKLLDEIFSSFCEKHFIQPTFILDYPIEMSPLTKKHRSKAGLVERFELIINGKEIANAYTELNDPIDQRERFLQQAQLKARGDEEAMFVDYDFLRALEYGMPPATGIGIGIDRLCMLLTGQPSIQDVVFFPHMRPEPALTDSLQKEKKA